MRRLPTLLLLFALGSALGLLDARQDDAVRVLEGSVHLGDDLTPEWPEAPEKPSRAPVEWAFDAPPTRGPWTLEWTQRHVDNAWTLELNGQVLGQLPRGANRVTHFLEIPAGLLRREGNRLRLSGSNAADDFTFGDVLLHPRPLARHLGLGRLSLRVTDEAGGPLPARITLVGPHGEHPVLRAAPGWEGPVRPGVAYTTGDRAELWVPAGDYRLSVSRGVEWSREKQPLSVVAEGTHDLTIRLVRQFEPAGFVSADTHLHTLTFSGHGDASLDERLHTLAGEGVRLAIATDHNHQTDYATRQAELGLDRWYTAVTGNEVTTENGHFNAFPLPPGGPKPDPSGTDWAVQIADMRAKGARVVILNHPRWPVGTSPFDRAGLDALAGHAPDPIPLVMDALELFNSTTPENHPDDLIADWFGLLNAGHRLVGVGSSDSHTVADPVGAGRTYLQVSGAGAGPVDVEAACDALLAGAASASLGLYAELLLDGEPVMGRTIPVGGEPFHFQLRVAAPHWAHPETASVYLDGMLVEERRVGAVPDRPTDTVLDFRLPPLRHDSWLVAVVRGPRVEEDFWNSPMHYTAAFTNPVRLEDGDGVWKDLPTTAAEWLDRAPSDTAGRLDSLQELDPALLQQAAWLLKERDPASFDLLLGHPGPHQEALRRVAALRRPAED